MRVVVNKCSGSVVSAFSAVSLDHPSVKMSVNAPPYKISIFFSVLVAASNFHDSLYLGLLSN